MADTTDGDNMVLYLDLLIPALIALIAGLVIHSFIIVVNVNDWRKGRSVTPVDQVVMSLGISRMCHQCAATIIVFMVTLFLESLRLRVSLIIMEAVSSFLNYVLTWYTSLLSVVFCLKISSLRTRLFLYLKRMIEQKTVHFIVASVLLSAFSLLPLPLVITEVINDGTYNTTTENLLMGCNFNKYMYAHAVGATIPLLFYYFSSVLLFLSLYHHTRRMKMSGNLSINLDTYYSAMKFVTLTFLYKITYCIINAVFAYYYYIYCVTLFWLYISMGFLPALHSCYLIYRTAKLRSQMSKVLQNVVDLLLQWKNRETRENIELVA